MPVTFVNLEESTPMDQLLIALVGKEKSGKSRLAATARKPILFFDWDGRAASLAGRKGVYAVSFTDQTGYMQPDAADTWLSIMTQLEANGLDLACVNIRGQNFGVEQGTIVQTLVHDSVQRMSRAFMRYILANGAQNKGMVRELKVNALTIRFPGGFEAWNAEMIGLEDALLRTFASKKDVIVIFHEDAEEAPESTQETPIFTGKVGIYPKRHLRLLGYFNEVWRVQRGVSVDGTAQGAIPVIQTAPDYYFQYAASALDVNANEVPDISKMIDIHRAKHGGSLTPAASAPMPSVAPTPVNEAVPVAKQGPRLITSTAEAVKI